MNCIFTYVGWKFAGIHLKNFDFLLSREEGADTHLPSSGRYEIYSTLCTTALHAGSVTSSSADTVPSIFHHPLEVVINIQMAIYTSLYCSLHSGSHKTCGPCQIFKNECGN